MSDLEMFADTLALIREADNIQALNQCMFAIRDAYGVANVAYHAVSIPGRNDTIPMLLQTYDSAWVNRYIELGYLRSDPVVQVTRRSLLPLDWIDIERSAPGAREFFSDADRFGVGRNGLSFPIRGVHGERALFTVTANVADEVWSALRLRSLRDFQTISHYIHDKVVRIFRVQPAEPARAPSPQERRCLEAFGRGHTPKQIAAEMRLSDSAVRLYLHAARQKLSCVTITQAVSRALRLAIIDM
jgi:DNA-binding CsgD family transcriptional regulator